MRRPIQIDRARLTDPVAPNVSLGDLTSGPDSWPARHKFATSSKLDTSKSSDARSRLVCLGLRPFIGAATTCRFLWRIVISVPTQLLGRFFCQEGLRWPPNPFGNFYQKASSWEFSRPLPSRKPTKIMLGAFPPPFLMGFPEGSNRRLVVQHIAF